MPASMALPSPNLFVAGFSPGGSDSIPVVDKVALGQILLRILRVSCRNHRKRSKVVID
jgi:hypothetical protein